jgi:hypothetical protein
MRQSRQSKNEKILFDFYRRCYKAATPSADFDELVENAEVIDGRKHIKYNDYLLEEDVFDNIIKDIFKQYRVSKYDQKAFMFEFNLGCAPKIKMNDRA